MTFLYFVILLSIIISLHEAGHLIAAKLFGVYCSEYSLGMGPTLFSYQGKETKYSLRLLPIGGFVAMAGDNENPLESSETSGKIPFERTLLGVAKWKKIIIMLAGIFMNFVLALVIIAMVLLHNGSYQLSPDAVIHEVKENSPAAVAGLLAGDRVLSMTIEGGATIHPDNFEDMSTYLLSYEGKGSVWMEVQRDSGVYILRLSPELSAENGRYLLGVSALPGEVVTIHFANCWYYAFAVCGQMINMMILTLAQLFRGIGVGNLSGPLGIYRATGTAASAGLSTYFYMMALVSLNIGFMNLLPLPILDGGRVFLTILESIFRKPIPKKVENGLMIGSTLLILVLFLYATFNDIARFF